MKLTPGEYSEMMTRLIAKLEDFASTAGDDGAETKINKWEARQCWFALKIACYDEVFCDDELLEWREND